MPRLVRVHTAEEARALVDGLWSKDLGFIVELILSMLGDLGDTIRFRLVTRLSTIDFIKRSAKRFPQDPGFSTTLWWLRMFDRACWGLREYGFRSNTLHSVIVRFRKNLIDTHADVVNRCINDGVSMDTLWPFPHVLFCPEKYGYHGAMTGGAILLRSMHDLPKQRRNPEALRRVLRLFDDYCDEFTGLGARRRAWYAMHGRRYGNLTYIPEKHQTRIVQRRGRWVLELMPKTKKERREHNRQKAVAIEQGRAQRAEEKRRARYTRK